MNVSVQGVRATLVLSSQTRGQYSYGVMLCRQEAYPKESFLGQYSIKYSWSWSRPVSRQAGVPSRLETRVRRGVDENHRIHRSSCKSRWKKYIWLCSLCVLTVVQHRRHANHLGHTSGRVKQTIHVLFGMFSRIFSQSFTDSLWYRFRPLARSCCTCSGIYKNLSHVTNSWVWNYREIMPRWYCHILQ